MKRKTYEKSDIKNLHAAKQYLDDSFPFRSSDSFPFRSSAGLHCHVDFPLTDDKYFSSRVTSLPLINLVANFSSW
jgi:hypothetical protein